jgi:O-methyltransferase
VESIKRVLRKLLSRLPFTRQYRYRAWVTNEYNRHTQEMMKFTFLSIARFAHINRPIDGYYFEFGSHEARTMRLAWRHFQHLFKWDFIAFDSFEGLPEIEAIDKQEIWSKGKLETKEEDFIRIVTGSGMPRSRLTTVKGFYDQTLTSDLQEKFLPRKAAVVYVDCDLYMSTVPVLRFIRPFLQAGTVVVFDDWNCFHADPRRGERRAWHEFLAANPELRFEELIATDIARAFVCVRIGDEGVP